MSLCEQIRRRSRADCYQRRYSRASRCEPRNRYQSHRRNLPLYPEDRPAKRGEESRAGHVAAGSKFQTQLEIRRPKLAEWAHTSSRWNSLFRWNHSMSFPAGCLRLRHGSQT